MAKHKLVAPVSVESTDSAVSPFSVSASGVKRFDVDAAGLITGTGTSLGAWTAYTPTVTAGTGTFTTVSATGAYVQIGKIVIVRGTVTITTNGTAAATVIATLPITQKTGTVGHGIGREVNATGNTVLVQCGSTNATMFTVSNGYPGGTGYTIQFSATYEAA